MTLKPSVTLLAAAVVFSLSACTEQEIAEYCAANPNDPRCSTVQPDPTPSPAITPDNATIDSVNGAANAALKAGENNLVTFTIYDDGKPLSGTRPVEMSIVHYDGNVQGTLSNGGLQLSPVLRDNIVDGSGSFIITPAAAGRISVRLTVLETGDFFTRHLNVNAAATPVNPNPSDDPCAGVGAPGKMNGTQAATQAEKCAILKAHNDARAAVGKDLPNLKWSDNLANTAFTYAKQCKLQPSGNGYGENFWNGPAGYFTVTDAVGNWVDGKKNYNGQPIGQGNFNAYGLYTQVVWKNTTEVGCGYAKCGGNVIMTCNYNPAGNVTGTKPY